MIWYYLVICNVSALATALSFGFNAIASYNYRVTDVYHKSSRTFNESSRAFLDGNMDDGVLLRDEANRIRDEADRLNEDCPRIARRCLVVSSAVGVAVCVAISTVLWNLQ